MKKYKCKIFYKNSVAVDGIGVTFKKLFIRDFKFDGENINKKLTGNILDKVNTITNLLALGKANIVFMVGGKAPHEELASHSGFWKVSGKGVLPNSYFPVVAQKDIKK